MAEDGKLKIDSMMVMISVSVRCRLKTLYIRRSFRSLWQNPNLQKGHFQNQCLKLVASKNKEVSMARDSDDALVCCVENTVKDRVMDSGIGDVVLKTSFGIIWTPKDVSYILGLKRRLISIRQLDKEGYHVDFRYQQWKVTKGSLVVARRNKHRSLYMVEDWYEHVSFQRQLSRCTKVIKDCSMSCDRAKSMGIRAEASKMLWVDSVSTTYSIYCIPYVPIGLRILKEEWRRKDTSLTHLKVFGCDSFVKVKDVCGVAMKCTFIDSGLDKVRYNFRIMKSHQVIRSRDIIFVDLIYGARDIHQVGDEREVEVMRSFNWPPSELIAEDGVLPVRGYS
nr:hypothetical protein [Tanacetum cinerariifolium]